MIELPPLDEGVLQAVQAQTEGRATAIEGNHNGGVHDGRFKVAVTTAPQKGKANKSLVKVIAGELERKHSQVSLHCGDHSSAWCSC